MNTPRIPERSGAARLLPVAALANYTFLTGCAGDSAIMGSGTSITTTNKARLTQSGFLSDYARLKPTPWGMLITSSL